MQKREQWIELIPRLCLSIIILMRNGPRKSTDSEAEARNKWWGSSGYWKNNLVLAVEEPSTRWCSAYDVFAGDQGKQKKYLKKDTKGTHSNDLTHQNKFGVTCRCWWTKLDPCQHPETSQSVVDKDGRRNFMSCCGDMQTNKEYGPRDVHSLSADFSHKKANCVAFIIIGWFYYRLFYANIYSPALWPI